MNTNNKYQASPATEENVLFGVVGAFLFSLVGGLVYVVLNMAGFLSALSGLIGVVCAIKGYSFFAKKESKRGVVISVIMAAVVIIIAWYVCFCLDMVEAYQYWLETGEVDYAPTFFEYLPFGFYDLTVNPVYFVDLLLSLALGAVGCGSYISQMVKRQKAIKAQQEAQAATQALADAQAAQAAEQAAAEQAAAEQTTADTAEAGEPDAWAELNAQVNNNDSDNA